ncbi:cytochrome c1 [Rhizobium sp. KVB221]|uniref:Cytochrome c1 n=1 Tax=Rhizobium setariae TaxID=2801340 RepID=A0A936YSD8_9HYPH|nr:cytochrome c1 [Rhizobium setariae]MBL0372001.1 cytochrome c1 [Rhizobium setariae]
MKKLFTSIVVAAAIAGSGAGFANAAEEAHDLAAQVHHAVEGGHFPVLKPEEQKWTFSGIFGKYDKAQLQRGLKVYKEVCSACHSMSKVAFRNLEDLGYTEAQVKAFAADYEVQDGPNADGEMYSRKAVPSDYFPSPFPNHEAAAAANGGAAPPDFSLLAKARGVERGFPQFVIDMVVPYQEGGPDYIHALLTGYVDAPAGVQVAEGTHFNPHYVGGTALKMAKPISDDQVTYDDGSPQTLEQYSKDVAAFMMWAAEPKLENRKRTGFMVMVFLAALGALVFLTKRAVYASKH